MLVDKAVPILLREKDGQQEILVFEHPLAGRQLVKGTIEAGESGEEAAVRELFEESGLDGVSQTIFLGTEEYTDIGQRWHFFLCHLGFEPAEAWDHYTEDGGGLTFNFLWQPLDRPIHNPDGEVFEQARQFVFDLLSG